MPGPKARSASSRTSRASTSLLRSRRGWPGISPAMTNKWVNSGGRKCSSAPCTASKFVRPGQKREARLRVRPGHPRLAAHATEKTWMAGTRRPGHDEQMLSRRGPRPPFGIVENTASSSQQNPSRMAADGFRAQQLTLNKTPRFTGPVNRVSDFFCPQAAARRGGDTAKPTLRTV
jgi:hypothetical protein